MITILDFLENAQDYKKLEYPNGEVWKVIPIFPRYEASSLGNIRDTKDHQLLSQGVRGTQNYPYVSLSNGRGKGRKNRDVHTLVVWAFYGPPPTPKHTVVDHRDGNTADNRPQNLRWATPSENGKNTRKRKRCPTCNQYVFHGTTIVKEEDNLMPV